MTQKIMDKFNIQLFAEGGEGGNPPEPTPAPEPSPAPAGGEIEVPDYIRTYTEGITDENNRAYVEGLLKDEKGVNFIKQFIKDPNAPIEYQINKEDYKDMSAEAEAFIEQGKEKGWTEEYVKNQLEARKAYLEREREAMSPELRSLDPIIENFIGAEKDAGKQGVYARLAENAVGRQVLQELMTLKSGNPTPGMNGAGEGSGGSYTHESFIEAYNLALDTNDKNKLESLKTFAKAQQDPYFKDFLGL